MKKEKIMKKMLLDAWLVTALNLLVSELFIVKQAG